MLLLVLFLAQFRGTSQLGFMFAPGMSFPVIIFHDALLTWLFITVTFIWFILLAVTGIVNIVKYPGIFRAFDPSRAIMCK